MRTVIYLAFCVSLWAQGQDTFLQQLTQNARQYDGQLPSFLCDMQSVREEGKAGPPEQWKHRDTLDEEVRYLNGNESITLLRIDGEVTQKTHGDVGGLLSYGVLGAGLVPNHIFNPILNPQFQERPNEILAGRPVRVFSFEVAPFLDIQLSGRLPWSSKTYKVGFRGMIYADPDEARVLKVHQELFSTADFPYQEIITEFEYGAVTISELDFWLPVRARVRERRDKSLSRNEIAFSNYRKYAAESQVTFDTPQ